MGTPPEVIDQVIEAFDQFVNECLHRPLEEWPQFIMQRPLPDGRILSVVPLLYFSANLGISLRPPLQDTPVFFDVWSYQTQIQALVAAFTWDGEGEPEGWYRHYATRRRRPGGDPTKEYVEDV